jgi:hypothetical protein
MMRKYKIVAVLWEDHTRVTASEMVSDPDTAITPTLTVGILYKDTAKSYVVVSDIERYEDRDEATYTIIRKPIVALQAYGEIEITRIREKGGKI